MCLEWLTGTEASPEEGTELDKQTVNGAAHGEEDKEQKNDIIMRNGHGWCGGGKVHLLQLHDWNTSFD